MLGIPLTKRAKTVSPSVIQELSDGDTRFYASTSNILGLRNGLTGRSRAVEANDTDPPAGGNDNCNCDSAGHHPRNTRSTSHLQGQGSFQRAGGGDTIEGIDYPLILAPSKEVMAFIRIPNICYVVAFDVS